MKKYVCTFDYGILMSKYGDATIVDRPRSNNRKRMLMIGSSGGGFRPSVRLLEHHKSIFLSLHLSVSMTPLVLVYTVSFHSSLLSVFRAHPSICLCFSISQSELLNFLVRTFHFLCPYPSFCLSVQPRRQLERTGRRRRELRLLFRTNKFSNKV